PQIHSPATTPDDPAHAPHATQVPLPPGVAPGQLPMPPGVEEIPNSGTPAIPQASPSSFGDKDSGGPSVAVAKYNPRTGEYMGPDGALYQQANLAKTPTSWTDLMPT